MCSDVRTSLQGEISAMTSVTFWMDNQFAMDPNLISQSKTHCKIA